MSELVSIIIPMYNSAGTIERCVRSALAQTYDNIQIVVVNDGSTDDSRQILGNITDDRLVIIDKANGGLPQARRTGTEQSQGSYIYYLDSDDWIEPDTIELLAQALETNQADIACCGVIEEDETGKQLSIKSSQPQTTADTTDALQHIHNMTCYYQYMWNKLYRRGLIELDDFPESNFLGEDYYTLMHIVPRAGKITQLSQACYHYIQSSASMTKQHYGPVYARAFPELRHIKQELVDQYPQARPQIEAYHTLQYMAIINAMIRGGEYDTQVYRQCQTEVNADGHYLVGNPHYGAVFRWSVRVFNVSDGAYRVIFRLLHIAE